MQSTLLHKGNLWLERKLPYPGCTARQLQGFITRSSSPTFEQGIKRV